MKRRLLQAAAVLLGLALLCLLMLWLRPPCLILQYTGLYCTGCGVTHMVAALLRGDLPGAAAQNPFMLLALPLCALWLLAEAARYVLGKPPLCRGRWARPVFGVLLLLAALFTVLRNLPGFSWLAPAWAAG
ncbi:DUF2752 domain-containing protein [Acutalibacter caecimuris]|uniref:DUF2752 domain-containing protein n=1 Tax=Acutalibacter caecimuris TaxID=3093657 RepID=UPI002AC9ACF2|nr:DUF2752 domain-containing protein [Acutalibacter sp. M00118]